MRHQVKGYKLNRSKGHRKNMRRTMMCQLFTHERIRTTQAKALSIRSEAENIINIAIKSGTATDIGKVNARRLVASRLGNAPDTVKKLFDDIGPRYINRHGGYTRMFKLGPRLGDASEMVILELVEK
jgi:large subunit ribosomal protein L17